MYSIITIVHSTVFYTGNFLRVSLLLSHLKKIRRCEEKNMFSSVAQLCPTLCDPMDNGMPGFLVHHQLPELTQTHVHQVISLVYLSIHYVYVCQDIRLNTLNTYNFYFKSLKIVLEAKKNMATSTLYHTT